MSAARPPQTAARLERPERTKAQHSQAPGRRASSLAAGYSDLHTPIPLLTVTEVAAVLHVSCWFVYEHGEELGLVKVGGANRYDQEAVERYIAQRSCTTAESAPTSAPRRQVSPRGAARRVRLLEVATDSRPGIEGSNG